RPSGVQIHTMRRGGPAVADVPERARASSQGRASETPAARRNRRRSTFMGNLTGCRGAVILLILKQLALDDLVNERPQTVIPLADSLHDCLDFWPVGRLGSSAGGVGDQPFGQGAGELILVLQEQLFELVNVSETLSVRQYVGGVDLRPLEVRHPPA